MCVVCEYKLLAETPVLAVMETKETYLRRSCNERKEV
jgi:hypothetical protein